MWFNFIQRKAQLEGLWNLFLPGVSGLSQLEYALLAEITGRCPFAPEVFNCSAPGTFPKIAFLYVGCKPTFRTISTYPKIHFDKHTLKSSLQRSRNLSEDLF